MHADFLPSDEVDRLQRERWPAQAAWVAERSALFRNLWRGRAPADHLEALPELPLSDKAMLRASQSTVPVLRSP